MYAWLLAPLAAWQAYAQGPFHGVYTGDIRASWPVGVAKPAWVASTFANLTIQSYDGRLISGEVDLWAAEGLDPDRCAAEVTWNGHGVRIERPTRHEPGAGKGTHAFWTFSADARATLAPAPAVFAAHAFVFCPIDAQHASPPWGVDFDTIDMVAAGPKAKDAYCAARPAHAATERPGDLAGLHSIDLQLACGVLPRLRGRALVDDCQGDVLLDLDALGPRSAHVEAYAPPTGTAPTDAELRQMLAGDDRCAEVSLHGAFAARADPPWRAAVTHMGARLVGAWTHEGMLQPDR